MKYIIAALLFPVVLLGESDIKVSGDEISARDIAEVMGMSITRLKIAHAADVAIDVDIKLTIYREDASGSVKKIRHIPVHGTGNAPDWKHTFLTVGLCDGRLSVRTSDVTLRLPEELIPEFKGGGSMKTAFHPEATQFGYILFERTPVDSKEKYFLAATFEKKK